MRITDIKQANPASYNRYSSLIFMDPNARPDEILNFLEEAKKILEADGIDEITEICFTEQSTLPTSFGSLGKIKRLMLYLNSLSRVPETLLQHDIDTLSISNFRGEEIPLAFFRNEHIRVIQINGEFLRFPQGDYHLPALEHLSLVSNSLEVIPEGGKHKFGQLKQITFRANNLTNFPSTFILPEYLQGLNLNCRSLEKIPGNISECTKLQSLRVDAPLREGIPDLSQTEIVYCTFSSLAGADYSTTTLPDSVENIYFQARPIAKNFPDISACHKLSNLSLMGVYRFPPMPKEFPRLNRVLLRDINSPDLPAAFSSLTTLESFSAYEIPLTRMPEFLINCPRLKDLTIAMAQIQSLPEDWDWSKISELVTLHITGKIPLLADNLNFTSKLPKLKNFSLPSLELNNRYALITKRKIPLTERGAKILADCKFQTVIPSGNKNSRSVTSYSFLDFCAALGKAKLSQEDKHLFFDLLWNVRRVQDLDLRNMSLFLKGLNIKFKPLELLLQRRLVREVILQHLVKSDLVKSPEAFVSDNPEQFLLAPDAKPMLENVRSFLRNKQTENVLLGLQMLKAGGVPPETAEELLLLAKTDPEPSIRKEAKGLLEQVAPDDWQDLIKNQIQMYPKEPDYKPVPYAQKLEELKSRISPKLCIFFALLLRSKFAHNTDLTWDLDEFIFSAQQEFQDVDKLLHKDAVVFVNGTTALKKTELKEKLESIGVQYSTKYTSEVTHILIGKNPQYFDIEKGESELLIENFLQKYLSKAAPSFLEEAAQQGDTQMSEGVAQFLASEDPQSLMVGLEMLKTGGVPEDLLPDLLAIQKAFDDAKVRGAAKKLLERYAPADWLPMLSSRLIFKSISTGGKETDTFKRLQKLEKESSFEAAATLSLALYKRYKKGLRYLVKRATKGGEFHPKAFMLMKEDKFLNLSRGIGYTDWRLKGTLDGYYGMNSMAVARITFPKKFKELLEPIEVIDLHNCKVTSIPKQLTEFKNLKKLDASFNGLKALPLSLKNWGNLEELDLSYNYFESFPERVADLPNLKKLDLRNQRTNKLTLSEDLAARLEGVEILL